jgi:hypothetical protein
MRRQEVIFNETRYISDPHNVEKEHHKIAEERGKQKMGCFTGTTYIKLIEYRLFAGI